MLDFGEELTVETFKIPWLIWIQILILLLLMILLYCFSIFPLDLSAENNHYNNSSAFPSSSSSSIISHESQMNKPVFKQNTTVTNRLQPSQRGEAQSIKGKIATSTSRRRIEEVNNTTTERESTSAKEAAAAGSINFHPCHYFKLARIAFLKCLGLDSENSPSNSEQKKDR